jgi:hypothetical protein
MAEATRAIVRILVDSDEPPTRIAQLTARLRAELLDLDVLDLAPVTEDTPDGAKGVGAVLGWLSVTLGGELLKTLADRVADWAAGFGRTVEISVDGDTLKLGRVTREEQRELTREWLARHPIAASPDHGQQASLDRGYR